MSKQHQPELPIKIYAEAVVRSSSGESLLDSPYPVTSENVSQFRADGDRLQTAAQRLREAGFDVLDVGKVSITIAAVPEVYERSLHTPLEAVERPVIKELGKTDTATFINALDQKPFGEIDVSHTEWQGLLDGIAINEPIFYFQHGLPSATPPTTLDKYLSVPEGVAQGLNAVLAQQQGITGKGVKVAMVDSGWYPHPFFTQRNYNVDVVLAPGSTDKWRDDSGHGTGESANVLAIAPDVSLTMVKADIDISGKHRHVNSISAFRTAVALQPDIICCSWGSNQRGSILSPQNRVSAALVADAVRQGIIVIFAAGNGHHGFPAQHPDVIAAGGVYLHCNGSLKGTLEASNYASSFISSVYPGRQVPDVCGLVGNLPHGSYIMLPVPPGSKVDRQLAIAQDGTEAIDGWAAFSGTSAAAPQLAGICALMKQVNPDLSPAQVKQILQQTARDVVDGFSNPSSSGAPARAGPDLATGHGLANAYAATQVTAQENLLDSISSQFTSLNVRELQMSQIFPIQKGAITMNPDYSKLKENLDDILWEFEKILKNKGINEIAISLTESNFVSRSLKSKTAFSLRQTLDECLLPQEQPATRRHLLAAQGLLKLNQYTEAAIKIITKVMQESEDSSLQELAVEILGEVSNLYEASSNLYENFAASDSSCGSCECPSNSKQGKRVCNGVTYDCNCP